MTTSSGALSLVFEKANSIKTTEIYCDDWLMKFVIGKGGKSLELSTAFQSGFSRLCDNCVLY